MGFGDYHFFAGKIGRTFWPLYKRTYLAFKPRGRLAKVD